MTAAINAFLANGNLWVSLALTVLAAVIIPLAKYWVNRENEIQKNLAEERKKARDAQMEEIRAECRSDIAGVKEKIERHDNQFEKGNSRFGRIEAMLTDIRVDTGKITTALDFIKEKLK
jgi:hypothetical protein